MESTIREILVVIAQIRTSTTDQNAKTFKSSSYKLRMDILTLRVKAYSQGDNNQKAIVNDISFDTCINFIEREINILDEEEIRSSINTYFGLFQEEFTPLVNAVEKKVEELLETIRPVSTIAVIYTERYLKKLENPSYKSNLGIIKATEIKIIEYFERGGVPGRSKMAKTHVDGGDELHAHIPEPLGNHRILYLFESGTITFLSIGTHDELGLS